MDEELCTACGQCTIYCPVPIYDSYNEGLCFTKTLHIDYQQAIPAAFHVDENSCRFLTKKECKQCVYACSAKAIRNHPQLSPKPFLCDLCDKEDNGQRDPQCINVCPTGALYFKDLKARGLYPIRDLMRKHANEKAELIAKRLYPLPKESMWQPRKGGQNDRDKL